MSVLSVWAPRAERVDAVIAGREARMAPSGGGWWRLEREVAPGTDYAFRVDGSDPMPDPRSPWQPDGVHGPSRTVAHAAFAWTDDGWHAPGLADAVIYEIHIGTFTPGGTFDAAIERLPELRELGVTHVEVMPVAEFNGERGWGYDGVDLFAPHHAYGGPDGLCRLVDAAHRAGLAVLLDVVYNHLGPSGNYLDAFGPYFTDRYATPWGRAINYDGPDAGEVRRFVVDNALHWLRHYHVDGLRLDAIQTIYDASDRHVLADLTDAVAGLAADLGRPLVVTAETDHNDPRLLAPTVDGGLGLDAAWNDDFHHALHALLTGETNGYYEPFGGGAAPLAAALGTGWVLTPEGTPPGQALGFPGERLVGFIQNHDQIGNRARGERIAHLAGPARAKIAAAVVLTAPFVPLLFQGEDWAASTPFQFFSAHPEPELARAVRRGRRAEFAAFGWDPRAIPDPQARSTFDRSRLRWDERDRGEHAEMRAWYRALLELRRATPALSDRSLSATRVRHDAGRVVIERPGVSVAFNLGPDDASLAVAGEARVASPGVRVADGRVHLPPDGVAVLVEP